MPTSDVILGLSYHNMDDGGTPTTPVFSQYSRRTRSWTNTTNYSSTPRDELPINTYQDHRYELLQPVVVHGITVRLSDGYTTHSHGGDFTPDTGSAEYTNMVASAKTALGISDTSLLNQALLKALVKVADAKVNVAVTLAEASKTSDMIYSAARRIYHAYRGFRRGDLREVAVNLNITPRRLHKSWLEYKYGWMPLLMDVKNGAEFLAQQHISRPIRFSVSATSRASGVYSYTENLDSYKPGSRRFRSTSVERTQRVKIWCELSNPHLSAIQQLGLTNPALVVWELIPFSFVFDWFCSVGDYLQGLTALHGVSVRRAMSSSVQVVEGSRVTTIAERTLNGYLEKSFANTLTFKGRVYNRAALSVDPSDLYPPVQSPFTSVNKLVTGLALLRAQGRGLERLRI